jgi:hypothetical protein
MLPKRTALFAPGTAAEVFPLYFEDWFCCGGVGKGFATGCEFKTRL